MRHARRLLLAASIAALAGCSPGIDPATTAAVGSGCSGELLPCDQHAGGSAVRIEVPDSLGSGVYIGNDVIVTAAHVVDGYTSVTLISDTDESTTGEVLWMNKEYDIALVRAVRGAAFTPAEIACRAPIVGEEITAKGNPAGLSFVTMRGFVADEPHKADPWREVVSVDLTTIAGMSGGPVYDSKGAVIAITVGTLVSAIPLNGLPAQGGLGIAVPMSAVCGLLGREVV